MDAPASEEAWADWAFCATGAVTAGDGADVRDMLYQAPAMMTSTMMTIIAVHPFAVCDIDIEV